MSQTTGGFSAVNAKIEFSINGTVWTDISGWANSLKPGSMTRQTGLRFTHEGDNAIITSGKRGSIDIDCQVVYTEGTADPFEKLRIQFEIPGGGPVYLRWQPKGAGVGNFIFTTSMGALKKLDPPPADTEDPKPVAISFTIEVASITKSAQT
jgi:hypothetical protein